MMNDVIAFFKPKPADPKCVFCGKAKSQVARMIQSALGPLICNECVLVCKKRLEESEK